jgi:hypothetical protein
MEEDHLSLNLENSLIELRSKGLLWTEIGKLLKLNTKYLQRWRTSHNFDSRDPQKVSFSMSDEDVDKLTETFKTNHPERGEALICGMFAAGNMS